VTRRHPVDLYGEASLAAQLTAKDTLSLKYKQWQWVASTGKCNYMDTSFDLGYRHKFSPKLSLDVGAKLGMSDYNRTNGDAGLSGKRNDWMYTTSAGVTYAFNPNLSATLAYAASLGSSMQEDLAATDQFREFQQHLVSLGLQWKF
jgi:outer membrane autotransporter protein